MQLTGSRTAQEYNLRRIEKGPAGRIVITVLLLILVIRCLVYININMIRAGVVEHPSEWFQSGYKEIQALPKRYSILDINMLAELVGLQNSTLLKEHHYNWGGKEALQRDSMERRAKWTEFLAVGSDEFIKIFKDELGSKIRHRHTREINEQFEIREQASAYNADF